MNCEEQKPMKRTRTLSSRSINLGESLFEGFGDNLWQICPLDNGHYSKRRNMKDHIEECKRNCLRSPRKVECPFNPLHIIHLMEVEQHIMTCPNRVTILNSLCDFEPKRETIEGMLEAPVNVLPEIPNHWDGEENPEVGYDAIESTKFRSVLRAMPPGLSKAQKKAWKAKERQRWLWLEGETKEKPNRASPYPKHDEVKAAKADLKMEVEIIEQGSIMQSIIDGLSSANIADPRDAMLKRINARLKVLQMMEAKLKEEKQELQRQVEQYLATVGQVDAKPTENVDPRLAPKNPEPENASVDHASRILPDIMISSVIR